MIQSRMVVTGAWGKGNGERLTNLQFQRWVNSGEQMQSVVIIVNNLILQYFKIAKGLDLICFNYK